MMRNLKTLLAMWVVSAFISGCATGSPKYLESTVRDEGKLDYELNNLTNQIIKSLSQEKKTKIAIIEFTDLHGKVPTFGKYVAEELITRMYSTKRFEVVERQMLNKVLEEQKLGLTGLIDESSAAAIGRLLGVQAIATGTITDLGDRVRINARLITTEKAEVFAVASVTALKEEYIANMLAAYETPPASKTARPVGKDEPESKPLTFNGMVGTVEIQILGVEHRQDKLTIEVLGENKGLSDQTINLWHDSRIIDDRGNEYSFRHQGIDYTSFRGRNLVPGIPVRMTASIRIPEGSIKQINLMELQFQYSEDRLLFRNVPVPYVNSQTPF